MGNRVKYLDGLRGIAILIVLSGHSAQSTGADGIIKFMAFINPGTGVGLFFVISGYLIANILERNLNTVNYFLPFYFKRIFRLIPALYIYLLVLYICARSFELYVPRNDFIFGAIFTRNFFGDSWFTAHLWSLGVEEQFYLLLAPIFYFLKDNVRITAISLILISTSLVSIKLFHVFSDSCYLFSIVKSLIVHLHWLFFGVAAALYKNKIRSRYINIVLIISFLVLIFDVFNPINNTIVIPVTQALFFVSIILYCRSNKNIIVYLLEFRLLVFVGLISYSLYLWQQLFTVPDKFNGSEFTILSYPYNIISSFLAAIISYYLIEKPALNFRDNLYSKIFQDVK